MKRLYAWTRDLHFYLKISSYEWLVSASPARRHHRQLDHIPRQITGKTAALDWLRAILTPCMVEKDYLDRRNHIHQKPLAKAHSS